MTILNAIRTCLTKYAVFDGRAPRSEFWYFALFLALLQSSLANLGSISMESGFRIKFGFQLGMGTDTDWPTNLFSAIFAIPFFAALSRRLHDVGIAASYIFVVSFGLFAISMLLLKAMPTQQTLNNVTIASLVVFFGLLLIATSRKSDPGPNRYGPNPNEVSQ